MEHRKEGDEFKSSTVEYGTSPEHSTNNYAPAGEPKQPGRLKRHCQKYWWLQLIIFVLSTLIISLIMTYVALPSIAQKSIDDAHMSIEKQIVSDPKPDEVTIHVLSRIVTFTPFRPDLDEFNISLFLEDTEPNIKPFGQITIPRVHATKNFTQEVTQRMKILDMDQFIKYNVRVLTSKTFRMGVRGKTKLHLGKLPVNTVDFNKAVDLVGLNNFAGMEIQDIKISLTPDANGNNMKGTIKIPNPTVMTLAIGDVVQDITSGGKYIGNTTISNMLLKPGDNYFPVTSYADQAEVISILTADKSKTGILAVEAKAKTVTYNGVRLSYFEAAMGQVVIKLDLKLKQPLIDMGLDIFADGASS